MSDLPVNLSHLKDTADFTTKESFFYASLTAFTLICVKSETIFTRYWVFNFLLMMLPDLKTDTCSKKTEVQLHLLTYHACER